MELLTTKNFNGVEFNCYQADGQDNGDFWATREQIGQLLGYENPNDAIRFIHNRHADRLDKFSTSFKLNGVEGNRTVTRKVIVYNFRGLLEICRWSNQPKANDVMDFLWDVAEDIRKYGMYLTPKVREAAMVEPETFATLARAYAAEKAKCEALEAKIRDDSPYVTIGKVVLSLPGSVTIADAAQFMAQHGIKIGRNRLMKILREKGLLSKQKKRWNKPTQFGIEKGIVNLELDRETGYQFTTRSMVTSKGLQNITFNLFSAEYPLIALIAQQETIKELKEII